MSDSPNPLDALRAALEKAQAAEMAFWASGSDATERVQDAAWSVVYTVLAEAEAEREGMREALREIAAFNDGLANHRLKVTGSYGAFDEPGSVEIARRALNSEPSDAS